MWKGLAPRLEGCRQYRLIADIGPLQESELLAITVQPHEVALFAVFAVRAALAITAAVARLQFVDSCSELRHTIFEILVLFFEGPATIPPGVRNGTNCGSASSVCHCFEKAVELENG